MTTLTVDTKQKKAKVLVLFENLASGFSLAGDDDVDWEEVDRVDDLTCFCDKKKKK